tara:strand:+ start:1604 stop:4732 length:3129 start_codon:yes stop_codon:yes gene_type:complete
MINLTNSLIVLKNEHELAKDVKEAIKETWRLLENVYANGNTVNPMQVSASGRNQAKALAFIRYIPPYMRSYDSQWLIRLYKVIQEDAVGDTRKHSPDIFLGVISEPFPKSLMVDMIRGIRIFFLALWKKKSVLLTMAFNLPESKRIKEVAEDCYSEVLYCFRTVKMDSIKRVDLSIVEHLSHTAVSNFQWYFWRAVVASDWHTVEDINNQDLIELFKEIKLRKDTGDKTNGPWYPLSPPALLNPLLSKFGGRCKFDLDEVSKYSPRSYQDPKSLHHEIYTTNSHGVFNDIKKVWLKFEESYIYLLKNTRKKKSVYNDEQDIGYLNSYLFTVLPRSNETPPTPKEIKRKHIDGSGIPSLREHLYKRDRLTSIERFFDYLEDLSYSEPELEGFRNPIIQLDKPLETRRRVTNKIPFGVDDFRLLFDMVYSISEFSYFINSKIADVHSPEHKKFIDILVKKSSSGVLSTEEFGYIPFVSFKRLKDDRKIMVSLKYIPSTVLKIISVNVRGVSERVPFLSMQAINQTAVALETGLRHINIRWLDKRSYKHGSIDKSIGFFNLYVNTDKSHGPWIRPTSIKLLDLLEKQIESQDWIDSNHFDDELYYDGHKESIFGKISPIFMRYDLPEVYSSVVYGNYYTYLMYYFSLIKIMIGEDPVDELPDEVYSLTFDDLESFKQAVRFRSEFKSKYTPHGTRASVVSVLATILPADIIGQYVTGHVSVDHVKYYTVVTADLMKSMGLVSDPNNVSRIEEIISMLTPISIRADSPDSALRNALSDTSVNINSIAEDFGAISFTSDTGKKILSGMNELQTVDRSKLSILPTHICPFENQCPDDVKSTIGEKSCGQCPYSIKTVDHLTRIQAHCRYLARILDALKARMKNSALKNATNEQLDILQERYSKLAAELSAWILTEKMLRENYNNLKKKVLVNKPDMLKVVLDEHEVQDNWVTKLMVACEEAVSFPDIADSTLESQVLKCKIRLMTSKSQLGEFFKEDNGDAIIDAFRADMRAVCMHTGLTPKQLAHHIDSVDPVYILKKPDSELLINI